jgi:oligopeptide transport system substrate-binding protein
LGRVPLPGRAQRPLTVTVRRFQVFVVVVALALVAAACGGGSKSTSANRPRAGGTLRIAVAKPASLDPAQAKLPSELLLAQQLFQGLTTYDPATMEVRPGIAERWVTTGDQMHWVFTIRPGAAFANGRAITATDVKFTLERIASKGSTSPLAVQLELIHGYGSWARAAAPELAGVIILSPSMVRIDLDQPQSALPAVVGNPALGIVPKDAATANAFADQPVGSGPFRIGRRTADSLHLLPAAGTRHWVDAIDVTLAKTEAAAYKAFTDKKVDWAPVPPDKLGDEAVRTRRVSKPYMAELFYGFNVKDPKFADVRFREAIVRAVDREAIVKAVYGGTARPVTGLVADGVPGHVADPCGDRCRNDIAKARSLVAAVFAGTTVPTVQIDYDDDATQGAIAKAMQANLKDAGIPAALRPHPYADYLTFAISGKQELFRLGWIGAYPTPDAFLFPLFVSGLADNVTGFSSPDVDRLLKAARAEPDAAKRLAEQQSAERMIMAQLPVVPIAQFETDAVTATRVRGLVLSALGTFDATQVWLTGAR